MKETTSAAELHELILLLEIKQANEGQLLKGQFKITYESLKPVNLIKNALNELVTSPDFKGDIFDATLSLTAGYLSKKAVVGSTHNPLKQFFGTLLQMGVTSIISKNIPEIKSSLAYLVNNIFLKNRAS